METMRVWTNSDVVDGYDAQRYPEVLGVLRRFGNELRITGGVYVRPGGYVRSSRPIYSGILFRLHTPLLGFKKVAYDSNTSWRYGIAFLQIPVGAYVVLPKSWDPFDTFQKLRASSAVVVGIRGGGKNLQLAVSGRDKSFAYIPGYKVEPVRFNFELDRTCSGGIHFFLSYATARAW